MHGALASAREPHLDTNEPDRKLAAILAADMVGFSRLLGLDEMGTLNRLANARREVIDPRIAAHRGRIFKLMGDGILAEFPSAVLALRCAIEIQTGLRALNGDRDDDERVLLRIGVHQGEVVIDRDDLMGDGVNVAARIEPLALPGGICISGRVHEDSIGKLRVDLEDLGDRQLKNITRAVRVLRVHLPGDRPARGLAEAASSPPAADAAPPARDEAMAAEGTVVMRRPATEDADAAERTFVRVAPRPLLHALLLARTGDAPRRVTLGPVPLTIGRVPPCELVLPDREVSRRHCRIEVQGEHALLTDLDSTNGTFVEGQRIGGPTRLNPGARITIGPNTLSYERVDMMADAEATGTSRPGRTASPDR